MGPDAILEQRQVAIEPDSTELSEEFTVPTQLGTYSVVVEVDTYLGRVSTTPSVKNCP
jgi:hypothetical protein